MVVTRRPQRLPSSVPDKNTKTPASILESSVKKKVDHSSQRQDKVSKKAKLQSGNTVISAKVQEGRLSTKRKSKIPQPHNNNKSTVEAIGSTASPRIARNLTKRQSLLSVTFAKDKTPKKKASQQVGGKTSSIATSSQKSVLKERNNLLNVVPETSTQSPKKGVGEDMNKKGAQPSNIMAAKRSSLGYSQLNNASPPDSIKSKRKVAVGTQNKFKTEVKLHSASTKIVKAKSVMLRNSKRKIRRTSISIVCTETVTGYLNTRSAVNSPSLADSAPLENVPENKISSSLKPKSLFPNVTKSKEVSKNLSHGQNHISPSQSKHKAIKDTQIKDGSDVVRLDKVRPKRKLLESYVTDEGDAPLVTANHSKKQDAVSSSKGLHSKDRAKDSEVEADAPKYKKSKIKDPNAASSKGLKRSIGGKDKNLAGDSNFSVGYSKSANSEAKQSVPSPKLKKSKFTNPNKGSFEAKAKNVAGFPKSVKEKADELVPSPKKSKCANPNVASNKDLSESKTKNVAGGSESVKEKADKSVNSPKIKKSNLTKNVNKAKNAAAVSKFAKGEADELVPSSKKSKCANPNVASNKDLLEAKAKNVAGGSESVKKKADKLVPSPKKSKCANLNVVASNKDLLDSKAKNAAGGSESAKQKADKLVPSPRKSKLRIPNVSSNKDLFEAKAKNVAGGSESVKKKADKLVPKISKSKKKEKQDDVPSSQGVRCSTRKRFPPCERWRGQRPLFRFKKGLGFVFAGIYPGWKKDESDELAILKRMQELKKKKKEISKPVVTTPVIDHNTKEEVDVTLHCPFDTVEWTAVARGDKIPFQITKTFVSDDVNFGFLDINLLEKKPSQYSPEDNIHFLVVKGQLKVVIHNSEFLFNRCDSFIVPCSATYSIENVGSSKALLSYSTFRTPFFPHQEEMND